MRWRAAVLLLMSTGCAPALVHPMRVRPGVVAEAGFTFAAAAGRRADCYEGCVPNDDTVLPVPFPYASIGYGAVVNENIGLLAGLGWSARSDGLDSNWDADLGPRIFGLATLQDRWASVGFATDLALTGGAWTVLLEVRPGGDQLWIPAVGVFHRWFVPWNPREPRPLYARVPPDVFVEIPGYAAGGIQPSFDLGARITLGPLFVQWSAEVQLHGLRAYQIPIEGQSYSQVRNVISIGVSIDTIARMLGGASTSP